MPLHVLFFISTYVLLAGPMVDSTMTLSILSSRDAGPNIAIAFSFNVSYGPPSRIICERVDILVQLINTRESPKLFREVIRSRYISSTLPDMTRVTVRPDPLPRVGATYNCYIHVETRIIIHNSGYYIFQKGTHGVTTVTVTGELYSWICIFHLLLVANPPTGITASRTGFNSVLVSWSAPSSALPAGYEVFCQVDGGSTLSGGNTSNTELTLTGLILGTYSLFVVGYGAEGAPVLPSAHSNTASIMIGEIVIH